MDRLNLLGFRCAGNWPIDIRQKQFEKIKNEYISMISERGAPVSLDELSIRTGVDRISLNRKLGGHTGAKQFHQELGIPFRRGSYNPNEGTLDLYKVTVIRHGKYMTLSELSEATGVAQSIIFKTIGSVVKFNNSLGFPRKNSAFEDRVYRLLCNANVGAIECQKSFEDLYTTSLKTGRKTRLRYDFYISKLNLLVEADGNQHSDPGSPFYSEDCQRKDRMKEHYAENNGMHMVRLGYDLLIHEGDIEKALKNYKIDSTN